MACLQRQPSLYLPSYPPPLPVTPDDNALSPHTPVVLVNQKNSAHRRNSSPATPQRRSSEFGSIGEVSLRWVLLLWPQPTNAVKVTTTVTVVTLSAGRMNYHYLRQGERSEHWGRLRDWSFCPSFCVCTWRLIIIISTMSSHAQADIRTGKTSRCLPAHLICCSCRGRCSNSSRNVQITSLGGDMHSYERLLVFFCFLYPR